MSQHRALTEGDAVIYDGFREGTFIQGPVEFGNGEKMVQILTQYHNKLWFSVELVKAA